MFSFFRGGSGNRDFDHIVTRSRAMIGDARHSFDLATLALLTDAGADAVAQDIRRTDARINLAEQELRSELIVHVSVQGAADIGSVLGFTLLLKKIERIGDQAKNILDLAENGVSLADCAEAELLRTERQVVSELFGEAAALLGDDDAGAASVAAFTDRAGAVADELRNRIDGYMTSEQSARDIVPQAFYARYVLRIVANLIGAVRSSIEPVSQLDADPDDDDLHD